MLAPISWRVPPRHYGPWEQFVSLLTEGLVDRGVDVTLFATADSVTGPAWSEPPRPATRRIPSLDAKVWEGLHISAAVRARRRVRPDPQQLRLPAADLQRPRRHTGPDDDPRVLVRADRAGLREVRPARLLRRDQRRRPQRQARVRRDDPSRHRHARVRGRRRRPASYLLFFGRIHPDKGTAEAIEVARRAGLPLMIAGIVQDDEYFERFVEPPLDGDAGHATSARSSARRAASCSAAPARSCT